MNRRSFFKVCAVATAGAAAPSIALGSITKSRDPFKVIGGMEERIFYRIDLMKWQASYLYRGKDGAQWEWNTLKDSAPSAPPSEHELKMYREAARAAMERAIRRRLV